MIKIEQMTPSHYEEVCDLSVSQEQMQYVGDINEILCLISTAVHPNVILADGAVVGFFLTDMTYQHAYDFCEAETLGFRAFFIDQRFQGQGLGTRAMSVIKSFIQSTYPAFNWLYLTVNCKNPVARHCYEKVGFEDTQTFYYGGNAGPQHIMRLGLHAC